MPQPSPVCSFVFLLFKIFFQELVAMFSNRYYPVYGKKKKNWLWWGKDRQFGWKSDIFDFFFAVFNIGSTFSCEMQNVQCYWFRVDGVDKIMHCCLMPANYPLASTSHGNTLLKLPPCTSQTTETHAHASVRKKKSSFYEWRQSVFMGFWVILNPNLIQIRWGSVVCAPLGSHGAIMW